MASWMRKNLLLLRNFAEEAGYNYVFVKSSDLASIYVHGSQEKIGALFDEAMEKCAHDSEF